MPPLQATKRLEDIKITACFTQLRLSAPGLPSMGGVLAPTEANLSRERGGGLQVPSQAACPAFSLRNQGPKLWQRSMGPTKLPWGDPIFSAGDPREAGSMSSLEQFYARPPTSGPYWPALGVFEREVRRFLSVPVQTLAAPLGTSLLYLTVFGLSIGRLGHTALPKDVTYMEFLLPGILTMECVSACFQNPISSLMIAKWSGTIVDQLLAPLGAGGLWCAYMGGALIRCLVVAIATFGAGCLLTGTLNLHSPGILAVALVATVTIFGSLGLVAGLLCKSWDQVGVFSTFLLQPLSFLSGSFFSFSFLPEGWAWLPLCNPVYHLVCLFRRGVLGTADLPLEVCLPVALVWCVVGTSASLLVAWSGRGARL